MRNQYARNNNNLVILSDVASACGAGRSEQRRARGQKLFALQAKTTFGHRKSDKHERIRNPLLKEKRIAARLTAVSPAGSVGASASQRCPPYTRTAMTGVY